MLTRTSMVMSMAWAVATALGASGPGGSAHAAHPRPAEARVGMVASPCPVATRAGQAALAAGGSAVDAAVATSLGIAVCEPWASGLGGGAFMVVHMGGQTTTWDMREMAPAAAHRDMFVADGEVVKGKSLWTAHAAGIPGLVRGLVTVHKRFGRLPLAVVAAPAIAAARDGVRVSPHTHARIAASVERFDAAARRIFLTAEGRPWPVGSLLVQRDLAQTLARVVASGGEDFYTGATARELVRAVNAAGGAWTLADLKGYAVRERPPVEGRYRGFGVRSMGPPSSGGLLVVQMLAVLEAHDLKGLGFGSAALVHLLSEVEKRAFAMRAKGLGDPDHAVVDRQRFIGPQTVARIAKEVASAAEATPASAIGEVAVRPKESTHTSHFGVLLANGDAVAMTQTVNLWFGNGMVAGSTGVVLNNEMDDFSALPGAPNAFGLIGDAANAVAPKKRPLSSMTPTLLLDEEGRAVGVFGSPGGSTIITTTLQLILNIVDHGMDASAAVGAPRTHHQWYPDAIATEPFGMSVDTAQALKARGHTLAPRGTIGNGSALWRRADGTLTGAADPRGDGIAAGL